MATEKKIKKNDYKFKEGILVSRFKFDAGHSLPRHPKCGNFHGHTFCLTVTIKGIIKKGMIIDFHDLKKEVRETVIKHLDHNNLNDIFTYPSAENISIWIWNQLEDRIKALGGTLTCVRLCETPDNCFCFHG